jgi:hypothetical protein
VTDAVQRVPPVGRQHHQRYVWPSCPPVSRLPACTAYGARDRGVPWHARCVTLFFLCSLWTWPPPPVDEDRHTMIKIWAHMPPAFHHPPLSKRLVRCLSCVQEDCALSHVSPCCADHSAALLAGGRTWRHAPSPPSPPSPAFLLRFLSCESDTGARTLGVRPVQQTDQQIMYAAYRPARAFPRHVLLL